MMVQFKEHLWRTGFCLVAASLMWVALWNGYPLVYSDTSTYLSSGFVLDTPIDRPITYGLFIRLVSLNGTTLWLVAIVQATLLAYLLRRFLFEAGVESEMKRLGLIAFTAAMTGLPFSAGQLITDVFTPILFVVLYLLLFAKSLTRRETIFLMVLFVVCQAMHMSHIGLTGVVLAIAMALKLIRKGRSTLQWKRIIPLLLLAVIGTVAMGPSLAKSGNTFYAARMAEHGVLQRYLEKHCESQPVTLCARQGTIPASADSFLWSKNSPQSLYASRAQMEAELGLIRSRVLADSELRALEVAATIRSIGVQLIRFAPGDGNGNFGPGTLLYERLVRHVPADSLAYMGSKQMAREPFMTAIPAITALHHASAILALVALVVMVFVPRLRNRIPSATWAVIAFACGAFVLNAVVNAGLVTISDRFGIKMAWALPFSSGTALLAMHKRGEKSKLA